MPRPAVEDHLAELGQVSRPQPETATSYACAGSTPPRMKILILFQTLVQAKKVGLTLVLRVRHQFDLGALWYHRLLPPAGRARRVESRIWGIPLGNHAHWRSPEERDEADHACLLLWFGCT
jgi:hypothetical protein